MTAGLGLGAVFVDIVPSLANAMDSMKTGGSDAANAFAGAFADTGKGKMQEAFRNITQNQGNAFKGFGGSAAQQFTTAFKDVDSRVLSVLGGTVSVRCPDSKGLRRHQRIRWHCLGDHPRPELLTGHNHGHGADADGDHDGCGVDRGDPGGVERDVGIQDQLHSPRPVQFFA
jgi:hypothetical protein